MLVQWEELTQQQQRDKVSHAIRDASKEQSKNRKPTDKPTGPPPLRRTRELGIECYHCRWDESPSPTSHVESSTGPLPILVNAPKTTQEQQPCVRDIIRSLPQEPSTQGDFSHTYSSSMMNSSLSLHEAISSLSRGPCDLNNFSCGSLDLSTGESLALDLQAPGRQEKLQSSDAGTTSGSNVSLAQQYH